VTYAGGVPLAPAPARLVEDGRQTFGRFAGPIARTNLIDAALHHLPRPLRKLRLKEWQAVQVASPDVFLNVALFDAKLMSLLQAKIYDRARGEKIIHEWKLRPFAFAVADTLLDSTTAYRDHLAFRNELAQGRITIELDLPADGALPAVKGRLELDTRGGASHVASQPLVNGGGMYSHKGMFPITGSLTVGERTYVFTAANTRALLDDHKGTYPYVMRWDWVTSARCTNGRAEGFNLTRNQARDPDLHNENCAWLDERIGLLPAVTFTREHERTPEEVWRIRDRDGRVDLTFRPTVPGDVRVNAVVVESRYRGPFGQFHGRLEPEGLPPIVVDDWFGMGEDFHLRC
jgi:hypothetical protein